MMRFQLNLFLLTVALMVHSSVQSKCSTCNTMVEKFTEGLKKTAKSNFGGGNTRWEEKSLGTYAFSETRLLEILESVCSSTECHTMVEENEEAIENWWFKYYAKNKDITLRDYFCVERLKNGCCPKGKYGVACLACPGGADNPCKGSGTCGGDGTKDGTGMCACNSGYKGDLCDECVEGYFEESKDDKHTVCTACHESCKGGCTELGPGGCNDCKDGWLDTEDEGCQDINECEGENGNPCSEAQFCSNTQGSYECTNCNIGCNGCTAAGPNKCLKCADRYYIDGETCKACHISCLNSCTAGGADNCDNCKEGWLFNENLACIDVNECDTDSLLCEDDQFCLNTPGSYRCNFCSSSCNGCTGNGDTNCKECKMGYRRDENGACKDEDECASSNACQDNEVCTNTEGSFTCECDKGYTMKAGKCIKKGTDKKTPKKEDLTESTRYRGPADCTTCQEITEKVFKGIDATEGRNFGGGNTKWEEEKIGSYLTSETRLTEIIEQLCDDSSATKQKKCAHMVERYEENIEKWWFNSYIKQKDVDLYTHLCIDTAQICCPNGTYGRNCKECPGGVTKPCFGMGKCNGDGIRSGTGKCECDSGYNGTDCNICADLHFEEERNDTYLLCTACDESCNTEGCTATGPKGCKICKVGYTRDIEQGCLDNNECETDTPCTADEYCENKPGLYACNKCDYTCVGCTGAGNDHCMECKERHFKDEADGRCKTCDRACKDGCTGPGREHCIGDCRFGYVFTEGQGCQDIDECVEGKHQCPEGKYCENVPGHFQCKKCEEHCSKCTSATGCEACEPGFTLVEDNSCMDVDECESVKCEDDKVCLNTAGSYICGCHEGYTLDENNSCVQNTDKREEL